MKILYYFSTLTILLAFVLMGYVGYLMFKPFHEPVVVQPFQILNENKEVHRGEVLQYEAELEKFQDVIVTSYKNIVCKDGNLVTLANFSDTRVPVGRHKVTGEQVIPHKTSLGECKLTIDVTYHVSRLKDVHRHRETDWFFVLPEVK